MAQRPGDRFASMDELLRVLERSRSGWFRAVASVLRKPPGRRPPHRGVRWP